MQRTPLKPLKLRGSRAARRFPGGPGEVAAVHDMALLRAFPRTLCLVGAGGGAGGTQHLLVYDSRKGSWLAGASFSGARALRGGGAAGRASPSLAVSPQGTGELLLYGETLHYSGDGGRAS